jgi:hypothetical protein
MSHRTKPRLSAIPILAAGLALLFAQPSTASGGPAGPAAASLVPEIEGWSFSEAPQVFAPDNLYEYIDGAAESYLAYDFRELAVAQYQKTGSDASMTIEIYDMGSPLNAFGIYSVERYPENKIVSVGAQGYVEDEVLNFYVGGYYVKIVCFNTGDETASVLEKAAGKVAAKAGPAGSLPALLSVFPAEGLVAHSEKYIRKNVLGFDFFRNGYVASYKNGPAEFDAFVIEADKGQEPGELVKKLLEFFARDKQTVETIPLGYRIRNKYSQQMEIAVAGRFVCGVNRVPAGSEVSGEACLGRLVQALKTR